MENTSSILRVDKTDPSTVIAVAIVNLTKREIIRACRVCPTNDCKNCMTKWYCARNSSIRILRNIFGLPVDKDVPKSIFHISSKEAVNLIKGIISNELIDGIERIKKQDHYGKLIEQVPGNETCPSCNKVVPPSRFGYVIYGSEPVCWECDIKRSKKFDKVIGG